MYSALCSLRELTSQKNCNNSSACSISETTQWIVMKSDIMVNNKCENLKTCVLVLRVCTAICEHLGQ